MKNSRLIQVPRLPSAAWAPLFAAATAGLAVASPTPQLVTAEVVALPGPSTGVEFIRSVSGDESGSWVATAFGLGPFAGESVIFGVLSGSGNQTPSILRGPQLLAGYDQEALIVPRVQGDRVAYTARRAGTSVFSSWIDDSLIVDEGIPIGTSGLEWITGGTPMLSDGPDFYVLGQARPIGGTAARRVVVRFPSEEVVLETGTGAPGLSGQITLIRTFSPTPSGTGWAAAVTFESGNTGEPEEAILMNGSVLPLPNFSRANTETTAFQGFGNVYIDDGLNVVFECTDAIGPAIYRDGEVAFRGNYTETPAVDSLDRFVTFETFSPGLGLSYEGIPLDRPGASAVDADGDGDADAGWSIVGPVVSSVGAAFLPDGGLLTVASLQVPGVGVERAVVRARLMLPDDVICEGAANSRGPSGGVLRAVGSDVPTLGDLQFRVTDVPFGVLLPIVSRTQGFVANPGGSAGNLCLSGSIGRGAVVDGLGNATFGLFPAALPQPSGFVAAQAGESWFFQVWYRDFQNGQSVSNFTSAVSVTFR